MIGRELTDFDRKDVAAIGRYVRRLEIGAMAERQTAHKYACQGRPVRAEMFISSAAFAEKQATELKERWGKAEGFNQGYAT